MNIIDLEKNHHLTDVNYKGISVWMLIRSKIELENLSKVNNYSMQLRQAKVIPLIRGLLYGICNIFRLKKFDFWFFSNNDKRFLIDKKLKDIYFDDIADELGQDNSLFIEYSKNNYTKRSDSYSRNTISDLFFKLCSQFVSLFININSTKQLSLITDLIGDNMSVNIKRIVKLALAEYLFYDLIFKIFRPKKIFLICNYSKTPMISAARHNEIPVIEYQHGVIVKNDAFYNSHYNYMTKYFPNKLYTFGTDLLRDTPSLFIFEKLDILPRGSYYLDYVSINFKSSYIEKLKKEYRKVVCVAFSGSFFDDLLYFVKELSIKHPDFIFILKPKHKTEILTPIASNIIVLPEYHIYEILKYSDYNLQISSFVAYEAEYYGVYNILFNVNGKARMYISSDIYGEFVETSESNFYNLPKIPKLKRQIEDKYFVNYEINNN